MYWHTGPVSCWWALLMTLCCHILQPFTFHYPDGVSHNLPVLSLKDFQTETKIQRHEYVRTLALCNCHDNQFVVITRAHNRGMRGRSLRRNFFSLKWGRICTPQYIHLNPGEDEILFEEQTWNRQNTRPFSFSSLPELRELTCQNQNVKAAKRLHNKDIILTIAFSKVNKFGGRWG